MYLIILIKLKYLKVIDILAEAITLISLLENRKAGIIFLIRNKFPTNLKLRMNRLNNAITAAAIVTSAVAANVRPTDYKQIGVNDAWFNMRYVPEVDQVEFIVSMNRSDNWLGLVLGQDDMMEGGDMAIFFGDGE